MSLLLGCIADDFTGAADLANTLVKQGMPTIQLLGVPGAATAPPADAAAVVIALKSRTIPAPDAVAQSLAALDWLRRRGVRQIFFKYCSTFDSTDAGNIGPVADALLDALDGRIAVACPAFPANGRTIYRGHLFVGDALLSDSGMRDHPLTPMTDANLVRVLARQTPNAVGLVPHEDVAAGAGAVHARLDNLAAAGARHAIVDAIADHDLMAIGAACAELPLVAGGSGVAMGLPGNFRRAGLLAEAVHSALPAIAGAAAVIAGSCSSATQTQVAEMARTCPALALDAAAAARGEDVAAPALAWARERLGAQPILIHSTAGPDAVRAIQDRFGRDKAGAAIETAMARIARGLVDAGVRRLVVAGGETAGAAIGALGVESLRIGPEIDPGVPWTESLGETPLALALKSGNFGGPDFFIRALAMLDWTAEASA